MNKVKFGSLFQIPLRNGVYIKSDLHGAGTKIVNMGELFSFPFISNQPMPRVQLSESEKATSLLEDGDLLFGRRSLVESGAGKCTIIMNPSEALTFESSLIRVRLDKSKAYPLFYYYWFKSPIGRATIHTLVTGSNVKGIKGSELKEIEVDYPLLELQKKIANTLFLFDTKLKINNTISAQLESLAKTIYDYWFLQFEFPNEEGKPYKSSGGKMVWNEELKKEIPEGWEVNELCKVFDITMGSSPKGESLNENHEGIEFYQGSTDFGDLYPVQRVYTTAPVRLAKAQDILISVRAPVGDMNIAMNDCCIGRGLAAVHYRSSLYTWNTLLTLKPYFDIFNGTGTTFGALTSDGLKQQHIVKPSNIIIEKYISRISKIELKLRTITIENQQLTSLRDFLLPLLMNGQVTFKDEATSEEE